MMSVRVSRRRYSEALRCLKAAIKNEHLSWAQRLRAVELLMTIYGVPVPDGSRRDKKTVRVLLEETDIERSIRKQVSDSMAEAKKLPVADPIEDALAKVFGK